MDTPLSQSLLARRIYKRWWLAATIVFTLSVVVWQLNRWLRPHIALDDIRVSEVRVDNIANTINAAGVVIPVHEEQVPSPIQTRVAKVLAKPGQTVKAGDLLLQLDDHTIVLALENLKEQVAQQENRVQGLTLEMAQKLKQLDSEIELLELDLQSAKVKLERYQKLGLIGATSAADMSAAELAVKRNAIQLRQHREAIVDTRRTTQSNIEGARLQRSIFQKQLEQQLLLRAQTQVKAPFDGMLTWLLTDEGSSVNVGQLVAKVSELHNFRVEATVSDFYARYLSAGQAVRVEYSGQTLLGEVHTVLPEIQNGTVKLLVNLAEPHNAILRNKLRVEANVITEQKQKALVIDNGIAINGKGQQELFVLREGVAVKTQIDVGLGDGKLVELLAGVQAGDRIIVSDISRYKHLNQFTVSH